MTAKTMPQKKVKTLYKGSAAVFSKKAAEKPK